MRHLFEFANVVDVQLSAAQVQDPFGSLEQVPLLFHLIPTRFITEFVFKPPLDLKQGLEFLALVFQLDLLCLESSFVYLEYLPFRVDFFALAEFYDEFIGLLSFHLFLVDLHVRGSLDAFRVYALMYSDGVTEVRVHRLVFTRGYSSGSGGASLDLVFTVDLLLQLAPHSEILQNNVADAVLDNPDERVVISETKRQLGLAQVLGNEDFLALFYVNLE